MCETTAPSSAGTTSSSEAPAAVPRPSVTRRSILGAALAGTGVAVAGSLGSAAPAAAASPTFGLPLSPILPTFPAQPLGTVITQLGTSGGPQAEYVRTGTSTVLTVDGFNYLIDAGRSSVTQYLNAGLRFSKLAGMFMTHLHADHLADYYNYFLLEGGEANTEKDRLPSTAIPVFGPGPAGALPPPPTPIIAPANPTPGIKDLTNRLNEGYAYSYNIFLRDTMTPNILDLQTRITDIVIPPGVGADPLTNLAPLMAPFPIFEDCRVRVSAILVPHGKVFPAYAYRFDTAQGSVVFSGDTSAPGTTAATNNVVRLAQGADVLVHEAMDLEFIKVFGGSSNAGLIDHLVTSHTDVHDVARVAQAAGVPQLVLTHLIPSNPRLVSDVTWYLKARSCYTGRIHVGNDLDRITLPIQH